MNHLKEELYQLMKSDSSIFDFIQEHAIDGISYASSTYPTVIWGNPALHTLLKDKGNFSNESNLNIDQFVVSLKNLSTNSSGETDKQEVLFQRADGQLINTACSSFFVYDDVKKHMYAKLYNIEGNVATNIQFRATDSLNHVLSGALYFYVKPNYDSIVPAIKYIEKDMIKLVETLAWKQNDNE